MSSIHVNVMTKQTTKKLKNFHLEDSHQFEHDSLEMEEKLVNQTMMMPKRQKKAMKEALLNPLILHKIIRTLDFPQLRLGRLINKTWNDITTEVLNQLDYCQLRFTFDPAKNSFYRSTTTTNQNVPDNNRTTGGSSVCENLGAFNQILQNSSNFPCTNFRFQGGNLGTFDPQNFFRLHGQKIKILDLYGNTDTPKTAFREILLHAAPHIHTLCTYGFHYDWDSDEEENFELPCLKNFEWCHATETARQILGASKNLEIIKNFRNCDPALLVQEAGKIFCIEELDCHVNDRRQTWKQLLRDGDGGLQLRRLTFRVQSGNPRLMRVFQKFLINSKNTLRFLELSEVCARFGTKLPAFNRLEILEMGFNSGQKCLPPRTNLSDTFPNLKIFDCTGLLCHEDNFWDQYFPEGNQEGFLWTVTTLRISDDSTLKWMQRLGQLCPNFHRLVITSEENNLPKILPLVWQLWPKLTRLTLKLNNLPDDEEFNLDSELTGLSKAGCTHFCRLGRNHGPEAVSRVNEFRIGPSISDLKDLKTFKIDLSCTIQKESLMMLTFVTEFYALSLLPDLKTVVQFDHDGLTNQDLTLVYKELGHFANIWHRKCSAEKVEDHHQELA